VYFAGRSRGIKVQWGYLEKKNKNSRQFYALIHLGKSVVKNWIWYVEGKRGQ
jgi:predicted DNA-binding WGR domain protein